VVPSTLDVTVRGDNREIPNSNSSLSYQPKTKEQHSMRAHAQLPGKEKRERNQETGPGKRKRLEGGRKGTIFTFLGENFNPELGLTG